MLGDLLKEPLVIGGVSLQGLRDRQNNGRQYSQRLRAVGEGVAQAGDRAGQVFIENERPDHEESGSRD
jgi:hypothetical protein